jgi:hypothetical protein
VFSKCQHVFETCPREIESERKDSFSLPEFTAWQNKSPLSPLFQRGVGGILSFVFCNYPIQDGIAHEKYKVGLPESSLLCHYTCIGLPSLSAREYLQKDNPVVCALAVFMNGDDFSPPEFKSKWHVTASS